MKPIKEWKNFDHDPCVSAYLLSFSFFFLYLISSLTLCFLLKSILFQKLFNQILVCLCLRMNFFQAPVVQIDRGVTNQRLSQHKAS